MNDHVRCQTQSVNSQIVCLS